MKKCLKPGGLLSRYLETLWVKSLPYKPGRTQPTMRLFYQLVLLSMGHIVWVNSEAWWTRFVKTRPLSIRECTLDIMSANDIKVPVVLKCLSKMIKEHQGTIINQLIVEALPHILLMFKAKGHGWMMVDSASNNQSTDVWLWIYVQPHLMIDYTLMITWSLLCSMVFGPVPNPSQSHNHAWNSMMKPNFHHQNCHVLSLK